MIFNVILNMVKDGIEKIVESGIVDNKKSTEKLCKETKKGMKAVENTNRKMNKDINKFHKLVNDT